MTEQEKMARATAEMELLKAVKIYQDTHRSDESIALNCVKRPCQFLMVTARQMDNLLQDNVCLRQQMWTAAAENMRLKAVLKENEEQMIKLQQVIDEFNAKESGWDHK